MDDVVIQAQALIAAIEVLSLVRDRDGEAGRPMTDVFAADEQPVIEAIGASLEGKSERQKNPHAPGSLAFAAWVCARLGGWTGYYGKAGPVVMLNGLPRLRAMIEGLRLAGGTMARTRESPWMSSERNEPAKSSVPDTMIEMRESGRVEPDHDVEGTGATDQRFRRLV
jgi:hypothetical protein